MIPVRETQESLPYGVQRMPASMSYSSGIPGSDCHSGATAVGLSTEDTLPCFWVLSGMRALSDEACQHSRIPFKGPLSVATILLVIYPWQEPKSILANLFPHVKTEFSCQGSMSP